jgi:hypothetical protein
MIKKIKELKNFEFLGIIDDEFKNIDLMNKDKKI